MVDPPPAGDPVSFTGQPLAPKPLPSPHYACLRWCLPRASQAVLLKWRDVDTCWGLGVTMQPVSTVHSAHVTGSNRAQVNYNNSQDFFFFCMNGYYFWPIPSCMHVDNF